tara:strand:- start:4777 stop:5661 length:885 start_codon:yes stop_codon:yes gene_type:complete
MVSKLFALLLIVVVNYTDARIHRINRGVSCHSRLHVQNERDKAVDNFNKKLDEIQKIREIITKTNCNEGFELNYENTYDTNKIVCDKCPINYYRTINNSTCLHCPIGYNSKAGSKICYKSNENDKNHSYCNPGSIMVNNPFEEYHKSCINCDINKKEYISYNNIKDKCDICPSGSIIINNNCIKCPIGYYEINNKCIQCNVGTFNNIEGVTQCKLCDNEKSFAYSKMGEDNCDNSYLYTLSDKINNIIDIKKISDPIIYSTQVASGLIYNNRKTIFQTTFISSIPFFSYLMICY